MSRRQRRERVELAAVVDTHEPALVYPETVDAVTVEIAGPDTLLTLTLPVDRAETWARDLADSITAACREARTEPAVYRHTPSR